MNTAFELRSLVFVASLSLLACGTPVDLPAPTYCSPSNCSGCCSNGTCVSATTASACGASGNVCRSCDTGMECVSGTCDYVADTLPAGARVVFVTSGLFDGNLGGLAGADAKCQNAAAGANLTGTFKAWLSDLNDLPNSTPRPTINAIDRINSAGPWYLLCRDAQKKLIKAFNNKAQLASTPLARLDCTELGAPQTTTIAGVWTGTQTGGTAQNLQDSSGDANSNCAGWRDNASGFSLAQGVFGSLNPPTAQWTSVGNISCQNQMHLYCLQD